MIFHHDDTALERAAKIITCIGACASLVLIFWLGPLAAQFCTLGWFLLAMGLLLVDSR